MKFLVDEMPYYMDDCPFYEYGTGLCTCTVDRKHTCEYFYMNRDPEYCYWLKEKEDVDLHMSD